MALQQIGSSETTFWPRDAHGSPSSLPGLWAYQQPKERLAADLPCPRLLLFASLVAPAAASADTCIVVNSLLSSASKEWNSGDQDYTFTFLVWLRNFKPVPWWFWVSLHERNVAEEEPGAERVPAVQVTARAPMLLSWEEQTHWTWSYPEWFPKTLAEVLGCEEGHLSLPLKSPPESKSIFVPSPRDAIPTCSGGRVYIHVHTHKTPPNARYYKQKVSESTYREWHVEVYQLAAIRNKSSRRAPSPWTVMSRSAQG